MKLYISTPSSHKKCMAKAAKISSFPKQPHAMKVREFTNRTIVHKSLTYPGPKHQGYSHHHPRNFEEIP